MTWRARVRLRLGALRLDVDLAGAGDRVALIGPNGSGKSTLLRTIAGAWRPDAGRICVGDVVLFDGDEGVDLPPEARRVGYVPQGYGLFPHLNALDNVAFGMRTSSRRRDALELLERLECAHLAARRTEALSGGEQQRIALARSLAVEPRILLLDEPLSALDATARRAVRGFLADHLAARREPSIVVTHDARDVRALAARVVVVEAGSVVQQGTAQELAAAPATEFVAEFFSSS